MITINIIGSGNVAQHLISVFQQTENIMLQQVFSRKRESINHLISDDKIVTHYSDLKTADITIISVTDDAIAEVSNQLPFENQLVVHTSGSVGLEAINAKNRKGVFYPLQTFSKSKAIDFKAVPICLETENESDYAVLESVAKTISDKVFKISSNQRQSLHVAAVFSCNFVNHLYHLGKEICDENNVPFEILMPLIQETADKIKTLSPLEAQTGPAKRNDQKTIEKHMSFLDDEHKKTIYRLLTQSIQKYNG
ncbi:hypothetical protein FSS13T_08340 [Flavobacterium saliperosum S13]|uniref:Predicted oxidoreductase, contains short-chain dehydrogenase (SDR) and DUF2520 domains n=2 Tax=Flavobacterium saliperosum TaxID=329186 RepID=A0A1G4W1Q0_9FLAO|nr:DUF2520 domain-containing protein [Flavobacterium saliperosum]ESU27570.1 hypothetical protein FSS13T_08340 [Flavobacterium saliperosum S13]SCX15317.1 Predicted oxidoreductase, contains short-chain dehydrogenase (SDR) and DUF2520 domains [Flavobacterium saliperosum]